MNLDDEEDKLGAVTFFVLSGASVACACGSYLLWGARGLGVALFFTSFFWIAWLVVARYQARKR